MFDDRFARQNRCEPPPEFPLASPYSGIVHHLSGPNIHALTQTDPRRSRPVDGAPCGSHLHSLSLRSWVCHPKTRTYVRLLGPCFKTGRLKPLRQHPKCEGVRRPAIRRTAFLGLDRRIQWQAITRPRASHSCHASPTVQTNADLLPRKYTKQKPG